ncbi:MAG: glutamate-ammonia-ligase adenylyltransferase [Bdellovibrio sp. ArHS]|uniref:[protein-PII] uridylyltransferase family protein n=1 Tax=Bdellovibrio sp. ArHS TaxID=1569284 RepID=UPI00058381A7|nr:glutamine-synthetase adenylyltransferase [Bdellovibrio sp. ArHS]KHD88504.1 MAG: glutamate-ammonia-ligase adenylyltransferase [Bdellovibrio sp. ArHS]
MSNFPLEEQLRRERNEIWSRFALASKNNSETAQKICHEWSAAADHLLKSAFNHCFQNQKIALFAFGKLGSMELNLSSDVDVLLVAENENEISLAALRKFQKILTERTFQGFVFRVDFDLRPGGKQGPMIPTLDQFKDYYGNYGETWERLAFVRLRSICGDASVESEVLNFAKKFSFRKHLDFTLLEDLKTLRSKIQTHYWARTSSDVIDLKLGVGGIRDVELFTHALQVIHGGKDPSLQVRGTSEALELLNKKQLLPQSDVDFLNSHYWNLRMIENYVQAQNDEQTHLINTQGTHPDFVQKSLQTLPSEMKRCDQIVKGLLGEAPQEISLEEELKKVGLPENEIQELWQEILRQEVLSRNKNRDELSRKAFLAAFLETLQEQKGDVYRGLFLLKDFIHGTRAKATFFSLLLREKELLQELAWLFGHSPYLSRILCNRPELLDSFVYRVQDKLSEDLGTLLEELAEKKLLSEVINGSQYLEDKDLVVLLRNLTSTADLVVETLLNALKRDHPSDIGILALGKWGGKELGFRSDLDFVFVVSDEPTENDFKVAKRFITRLTEPHRGGNIYSVDMRLRPSGKAGPIVIPRKDLESYLSAEAPAWERQAYLKGRYIGKDGPAPFHSYIQRGLTEADTTELEKIRTQLKVASPANLKYSEGGLVDIELAAQAFVLFHKIAPAESNTQSFIASMGAKGHVLQQNYDRLRQIEQMLQLVASESVVELQANHQSFQALALALQISPDELQLEVSHLLETNIAVLKELDPRRLPH